MPNYRRPHVTGASIFFTVTLAQHGSWLLVDEIDRLREAVRLTRVERPFHIDAWVVLPDHMHCVWTLPKGDRDFSTRWKNIKCRFTKSIGTERPRSASKHAKGEKGIWQRRFWEHHIRDDADYRAHIRYCLINPVKHELVSHPMEWPHSSIHRDAAQGMLGPQYAQSEP